MAVIRVEKPQARREKDRWIVSANVAGEELWFSSPDVELAPSPEAFLSAFLIVAQLSGDHLASTEKVCSKWKRNTARLLKVTDAWWKLKSKPPKAGGHGRYKRRRWFRKTALFFTAGVDSFHTLLAYPKRVHALINVQGFDIPLEDEERMAAAERTLGEIAKARRVPLVRIRTNLREHPYFSKANWEMTHGSALAAVAHLLEGRFHDFVLSSSTRAGDPRAWGSTWQIDSLWSSRSVKFQSWGEHLSRAEKAEHIADHALARDYLRVCWQGRGGEPNCGECPKCTRTMVALAWCGKLETFRHRFATQPDLVAAVETWKPAPINSPDELDPVLTRAERLPEPLRSAVVRHRDGLLADLAARNAPPPSEWRRVLIKDAAFKELMKLSEGKRVFYHKVPGNVGDDLIHAATRQLFRRFKIEVVKTLEEADQVVMCGGGSIGIWNSCAEARRKVYDFCEANGVPIILYPQSVGGPDETIPDIVGHRFVREWNSLPLMPGAWLMPDMALAYHVPKDYGAATHGTGLFLRNDPEAMFPDHPGSLGDPPRMVPRDLDEYFKLAAGYEHVITDRLHFAIIALLLKRKATLLPNKYHKNRGMWETWLKDLGCGWADDPEAALNPPAIAPAKKRSPRIGLVMCLHNEAFLLEANLRYHHALGVDTAYLFLDRCTDETEDIARRFPWTRIFYRDTPETLFHIRTHQAGCMNEALAMAREDGIDWLLSLDPDEFAFANNPNKSPKRPNDLRETQFESPVRGLWERANLRRMLRNVPDGIDQVSMQTREALPILLDNPARFWGQDHFLIKGGYPGTIMDPLTGKARQMDRWLGHNQGKSLVRTSARVEALNAHTWVKWQDSKEPGTGWNLPVPTLRQGWHAHYYCIEADTWLKKFQDVARNHERWHTGDRVVFPKYEWSKVSVNMTPEQARAYLKEGVLVDPKTARQWARKHPGINRVPVWGQLLEDLLDERESGPAFDD